MTRRDRDALALIAKVERRFRTYAVDRGGAPKADPVPPDVHVAVRAEWRDVRRAVTPVVRALRARQLARARKHLEAIGVGLSLRPFDLANLITKWIEKRTSPLTEPRQLADDILAKKHHCSSRAIKAISASLER